MVTDVRGAADVRRAYARQRLAAGLPPYRGAAVLRRGVHGPAVFRWPDGTVRTLMLTDGAAARPAPVKARP